MDAAPDDALSKGEIEILIDGLSDDVSFAWALIHLGIRSNPPNAAEIAAAFERFERLVAGGLVKIGRIEYVDPNQAAGTLAPVKHVVEPIQVARERVERECSGAKDTSDRDWEFCCWIVNTAEGNAVARRSR